MGLKEFFVNSLYILGIVFIVVTITHLILNAVQKAMFIRTIRKAIEDGNVQVITDSELKKIIGEDDEDE